MVVDCLARVSCRATIPYSRAPSWHRRYSAAPPVLSCIVLTLKVAHLIWTGSAFFFGVGGFSSSKPIGHRALSDARSWGLLPSWRSMPFARGSSCRPCSSMKAIGRPSAGNTSVPASSGVQSKSGWTPS